MTEITINFTYIFAAMYAVFKGAVSLWLCKREFEYPIWNRKGVQIPRGIHHKLQSFLRNWLINPEWALIKVIPLGLVYLVGGTRFIRPFLPWRVQKTPPFCQQCNDKGEVYKKSFVAGKGNWWTCECQKEVAPQDLPTCSCHVCLDQRTIGRNRPCPHCERRGKQVQEETLVCCNGCGKGYPVENSVLIDLRWYCDKCERTSQMSPWMVAQDKPLRYLTSSDRFCGGSCSYEECPKFNNSSGWLSRKQPSELHVGDSIIIRSIAGGHKAQSHLGKSLRLLGLNLPFAIVEFDTADAVSAGNRHIEVIDLRGMEIYGARKSSPVKNRAEYQPLLDPTSLREGDKFVMFRLHENEQDGSWRGEAFRVTKSVHKCTGECIHIPVGVPVIEAEHLSFHRFGTSSLFVCDGLQIIPVNDQYVQASKTHIPDLC